jgi:hypothetical protein
LKHLLLTPLLLLLLLKSCGLCLNKRVLYLLRDIDRKYRS